MTRNADAPILTDVLAFLEELAPLEHAEDWDNVGLLLEPRADTRTAPIARMLVAIDLTEAVVEEALAGDAQFIVAYHPPIFGGLKSLAWSRGEHRGLLRLLAAGVPVYSPHTALDVAPGGVNDWLATGIEAPSTSGHLIEPMTEAGQGRRMTLGQPIDLATLVERVKRHLGVAKLRVAVPDGRASEQQIRTVALCAGAGGSVLAGVDADVWLTGEMRHHDVLAARAQGRVVVLSEHTHTERGFLPVLAERIVDRFGPALQVQLADADADPLQLL